MTNRPFVPVPKPFVESDPSAPRSNPRVVTPDKDPSLRPLLDPSRSLVDSFGPLVDDLRQLYTNFGLRSYRLFSIITKWTGGEKGRGTQEIIQEQEILPTPKVEDVDRLYGDLSEGGIAERGSIKVTQMSPRYTEDDIRNLFHLEPLPRDHEGFLEMRIDARDGRVERRRFVIRGAPWRREGHFDWKVMLLSADVRRNRDGQLQAPTNVPKRRR